MTTHAKETENLGCGPNECFPMCSRYITALTDSEEEEKSEADESQEEVTVIEPLDEFSALLERVDALHNGTDGDKMECLRTMLDKRTEVGHLNQQSLVFSLDVLCLEAMSKTAAQKKCQPAQPEMHNIETLLNLLVCPVILHYT